MCQYTHIHHMGKESEDFITSAQAPQKDSPFIHMAKAQGSSGSGSDNTIEFSNPLIRAPDIDRIVISPI